MNPDQMPASHLPSPAALIHRTQAALGLLQEVVQESSAEYWYERGKAAIIKEEWEEAIYALKRCLASDDQYWRAALQLAVALAQDNQASEAAKALIRAYELPYNTWWKFEHEIAHIDDIYRANWTLLRRIIGFAQPTRQQHFSPWRMADILESKGYNEDDIFNMLLGLAIVFRTFNIMNAKATVFSVKSKFKEKSSHSLAWHKLSNSLPIDQIITRVYEAYERANYNSSDAIAFFHLGNIRLKLSDSINAFKEYDFAHEINPEYAFILSNKYNIQHNLCDYKGILANYDQAIHLTPDNPYFYQRRALIKERLGDILGATADQQKAEALS